MFTATEVIFLVFLAVFTDAEASRFYKCLSKRRPASIA